MPRKALKMNPSAARIAVRLVRTLQKQVASFMIPPVQSAAVPQEFHLSPWKAKAIIAAIALPKERQMLNNL